MLHGLGRADYAASYRNKVLGATRRLGRWAAREGYGVTLWLDAATSDVKRKPEIRRDRRLREALGPDGATEEDALLAAASLYMQALIIAGIDTAARIGELLALQWQDVSLTRNTLTIRVDLKNVEKPPRTIPLTGRLAAVLAFRRIGPDDEPHDPTGYVFGNEVGERIGSTLTAWENTVLKAHGHAVGRHRVRHGLTPEARRPTARSTSSSTTSGTRRFSGGRRRGSRRTSSSSGPGSPTWRRCRSTSTRRARSVPRRPCSRPRRRIWRRPGRRCRRGRRPRWRPTHGPGRGSSDSRSDSACMAYVSHV